MIDTLETDFSNYINTVYDEPETLDIEKLHDLKKAWFGAAYCMLCNMKMIGGMTEEETILTMLDLEEQINNYVVNTINKNRL